LIKSFYIIDLVDK